jgi:hypothetical protein
LGIQIVKDNNQILWFIYSKTFSRCSFLSISNKKKQRFDRDNDLILALKNWVISEKYDVGAFKSACNFWSTIYFNIS